MQEYLAEISGTLARKQQRKNTVLSHIYKQAQHAKRAEQFGFAVRPDDPNLVSDAKAAKHFLNEVRGEIGHHVARMHNPQLVSIEKDGEVVVRQLNNTIFRLTLTRNRWLDRCAQLGVSLTEEEEAIVEAHRRGDRVRKVFYGCAAELPEAKEQRRRREEIQAARSAQQRDRETRKRTRREGREEDEEVSESSTDGENDAEDDRVDTDGEGAVAARSIALHPSSSIRDDPNAFAGDVAAYLAAVKAAVEATLGEVAASAEPGAHDASFMLRREEAKAEEMLRRQAAAVAAAGSEHMAQTEVEPSESATEFVYDYCPVGCDTPNIPSDEELRRTLLEQRKAAMKAQLAALSKR